MWKGEPVSRVIEPLTEKLRVGSQSESWETRLLDSSPYVCIDLWDLWKIYLINFFAVWCCGADFLVWGSSPRAKNEWSLGLIACFCSCNFTLWRGHSLECSRSHANRRIYLCSHNLCLCSLPLTVINEGRLLELHVLKHLVLLVKRDHVVGTGVEVVIRKSIELLAGNFLVVLDIKQSFVVVLWLTVVHY